MAGYGPLEVPRGFAPQHDLRTIRTPDIWTYVRLARGWVLTGLPSGDYALPPDIFAYKLATGEIEGAVKPALPWAVEVVQYKRWCWQRRRQGA